ncbi:MAG TPA: hypothetical protein VNI83_13955, partial [Vicinamibacterales bacterium]|nr:hypothetical protein [Vicinamibacterales bacterium]
HPTDSHPPLRVRLESLGVRLEEVAAAALAVAPPTPAIDLFSEVESLEEELTDIEHSLLAHSLRLQADSGAPASG